MARLLCILLCSKPLRYLIPALGVLGALGTATGPAAGAEESGTIGLRYQVPPPPLVALADAAPTPTVILSPRRDWLAVLDPPGLASLAEVARPGLRLAGLRIDPRTNGPSHDSTAGVRLTLLRMADTTRVAPQSLPPAARIGHLQWAPDGSRIAYTVTDAERVELWVTELADGRSKRVIRQGLNAAVGTPFLWTSDSRTILCTIVPEGRIPAPATPPVPEGPVIVQTLGKEAPARTHTDLLEDRYDELLFHHHVNAQLMRVDVEGDRKRLGGPATILRFDPSPDGRFVLMEILHRPYSYQLPHTRFPRRVEVWSLQDGSLVKQVADLPLQDAVPTSPGGVPTGPRAFGWRADAGATLVWAEAQDGGDAWTEAEIRDEVFTLSAPFTGEPAVLASLEERFTGITWGNDRIAVIEERGWRTGIVRRWLVPPGETDAEPVLLLEYAADDLYGNPGDFVTVQSERGRTLLLVGPGPVLYLTGEGASPEGNRPFLDRLEVAGLDTTRLWRSKAPYYESVVALLDSGGQVALTRRESLVEAPNYYLRGITTGRLRRLTEFPDPDSTLAGVTKELLQYEREDGLLLSASLYLPAGNDSLASPLPMLLWVRPRLYESAAAAGQLHDSPYRLDRTYWDSPTVWATRGFAVLDGPALPILAEEDADANDTFAAQLVADAAAAVEEVVGRGLVDPRRITVGGDGYGALLAANLLVHSDLFRAGIARGGAYNLTLSPFGFPTEDRTLWEAPGVYIAMSPYLHAEDIEEPVLLLHGEEDRNPGTYPVQSERFFEALKGLGKTARLVVLPAEGHDILGRPSVLHMLWEMNRWLETYTDEPEPAADGE